jgi:uncharacterized protein YacL
MMDYKDILKKHVDRILVGTVGLLLFLVISSMLVITLVAAFEVGKAIGATAFEMVMVLLLFIGTTYGIGIIIERGDQ